MQNECSRLRSCQLDQHGIHVRGPSAVLPTVLTPCWLFFTALCFKLPLFCCSTACAACIAAMLWKMPKLLRGDTSTAGNSRSGHASPDFDIWSITLVPTSRASDEDEILPWLSCGKFLLLLYWIRTEACDVSHVPLGLPRLSFRKLAVEGLGEGREGERHGVDSVGRKMALTQIS